MQSCRRLWICGTGKTEDMWEGRGQILEGLGCLPRELCRYLLHDASRGLVLCTLCRNHLQCLIQMQILGSHTKPTQSTSGVETKILHV